MQPAIKMYKYYKNMEYYIMFVDKNWNSKENPFTVDIDVVESCLQMKFFELQSDKSLKTAFHDGYNLV